VVQDATAVFLKIKAGADVPAVSEPQFLRDVVAFANDGTLGGVLLCAPDVRVTEPLRIESKYLARVDGKPIDAARMVAHEIPPTHFVSPPERQAELRAQLNADLKAALAHKLAPQDIERLIYAAEQMVAVPAYELEGRRSKRHLRTRMRYWPMSLESILSHAVMLLLDDKRELAADLKQCQLKRCGQFFFVSDHKKHTGRPRTSYCSDEHRDEAHKATSYARVLKWRRTHQGST
jgi:hypothetical protein